MQRIQCPLCGGETSAAPATIAAFILVRCRIQDGHTNRRYCSACDFAFFERGLSDEQAGWLYAGYRGQAYTDERLAVEPGYIAYLKDFETFGSRYYEERLASYSEFLSKRFLKNIKRALDFGGDGYFLRELAPDADIQVFDLSSPMPPAEGRFDFIFVSNVLEHLSDPVSHGRRLAALLSEGGALFADVPIEYQGSLSAAFVASGPDMDSLGVLHEHINHFSDLSLESWATHSGLRPLARYRASASTWLLKGVLSLAPR